MADLNTIINVSISRNTTTPTSTGFGIPLIMSADPQLNPKAGTEWGAERVRTYTSLSGVGDDFATTTNVYALATALFAQNPAPPTIKVGRRSTTLVAQTVTFTVSSALADETVGFSINGTDYTVTATTGDTAATATAIAALTEPAGVTFSSALSVVTITGSTAGQTFRFGNPRGGALLDTTAGDSGTGLVTDFASAIDADNDFYCVLLDATSATEIEALSDNIQGLASTNPKFMIARTFDTIVKTTADTAGSPDTTSIAGILKSSSNDRTAVVYTETDEYVDAGWAGRCLPELAGAITWCWKQLTGVSYDTGFTTTHETNLDNKNCNYFTRLAGVNTMRWGTTAEGEYIDTIRGSDWLASRIRERVLTLILNRDKIPFTDFGIQLVRAEILSQLQNGVSREFLSPDPAPTCTVPAAADVSAANKAARHLTGVTFRATLAGAIHRTTLVGELDL